MRRREFITLLGGAAGAWPLSARAQQPAERMRRIGVQQGTAESDPQGQARMKALLQGMRELGWVEGRNLQIDYRWVGGGDAARARTLAQELISLQPDVIVVQGTLQVQVVAQETRTIPIVFGNVTDPVGDGFVASLAHPGGNVTGFSQYEYTIGGKWLGLLKEIAPGVSRVAVVMNVVNPASSEHLRRIESVAASFGVQVMPAQVRDAAQIERAIEAFAVQPDGGLIVLPGVANVIDRGRLVGAAARHRVPAIYPERLFVTNGGLMGYGVDPVEQWFRIPAYVDRILKGEKPGDLPVQAPTKYEFVLNLKTAKALGLDVPPQLSARADEVIE
jgi:putative ABC transport system substrate-binding protein